MRFVLKWLATGVAVAAAVWLVPGIDIIGGNESWGAIALFALVLSLVNMAVRPVLQALSLPITVLTLGLFYLVVNTFMLYVATWLANGIFQVGFDIASFGSAFVASIVISIVAGVVNAITGANKKGRASS
ncbi:MAG: phage holin family protein [Coriobacteriaceae bacterium]|jgi:putative membrane protein|nr:phage holin family protein [Coriobacteriaceae bacterium]